MDWRVPLSDLDFGPEESAAVQQVLDSRWLTMGAVTGQFEQEFAEYTQSRHAIAVTNATAALHMACVAAGLGAGDEAILPSLTFVATANAVRYTGATPIFADIEGETDLNISVQAIEAGITSKTRAILVVHYGGYACDMPAILGDCPQAWTRGHRRCGARHRLATGRSYAGNLGSGWAVSVSFPIKI